MFNVRTPDASGINFVDGIAVKGVPLSSINGAKQVGLFINPTDTQPTMLQDWVYASVNKAASLESASQSNQSSPTAPDKPIEDATTAVTNSRFVSQVLADELAKILGGAQDPFSTLASLVNAINQDPAFSTTMDQSIATRASRGDVQSQSVSTSLATGTTEAIVAAFTPALSIVPDGTLVRVFSKGANTSPYVTFTPAAGTVPFKPVGKGNTTILSPGDIASANYPMWLMWDLTGDRWVLLNPANPLSIQTATTQEMADGTRADTAATVQGIVTAISNFISTAPALIDTLAEASAALGGDANFAANTLANVAKLAPTNSPAFPNGIYGVTKPATDKSKALATTAAVKSRMGEIASGGYIPNATQAVAGAMRYASAADMTANASNCAVTPFGFKAKLQGYTQKAGNIFTTAMFSLTPSSISYNTELATTEFVMNKIAQIPLMSTASPGLARFATLQEHLLGQSSSVMVNYAGLKARLQAIPVDPLATAVTSGLARHCSETELLQGTLTDVAVPVTLVKKLIDTVWTGAAIVIFASPSITCGNTQYQQTPFVVHLEATPVGNATGITKFTLNVKNNLTGANAYDQSFDLTAVNNMADWVFTIPNAASNSTVTISATATDNLGKSSVVGSKVITSYFVSVNAPTIVSPTANQTGLATTPTFSVSGFGVSSSTDTHKATIWTIYNSTKTAVIWTSGQSASDLLSMTVASGILSGGGTFVLGVKFVGNTYGESAESTVSFSTALATLSKVKAFAYPYATNDAAQAAYGDQVSLSNAANVVVITSPYSQYNKTTAKEDATTSQGRAFIYRKAGAAWNLEAVVTPPSGYGVKDAKVTAAGDRIIVSQYLWANASTSTPAAPCRIVSLIFNGTAWVEDIVYLTQDFKPSLLYIDNTAESIVLCSSAAPYTRQSGVVKNIGAALVLSRQGTTITHVDKIYPTDAETVSLSGFSGGNFYSYTHALLSMDGLSLYLPHENYSGTFSSQGCTYLYKRASKTEAFVLVNTLVSPTPGANLRETFVPLDRYQSIFSLQQSATSIISTGSIKLFRYVNDAMVLDTTLSGSSFIPATTTSSTYSGWVPAAAGGGNTLFGIYEKVDAPTAADLANNISGYARSNVMFRLAKAGTSYSKNPTTGNTSVNNYALYLGYPAYVSPDETYLILGSTYDNATSRTEAENDGCAYLFSI